MTSLSIKDMPSEFNHVLGHPQTRDLLKETLFVANLVVIAECSAEHSLPHGSTARMCGGEPSQLALRVKARLEDRYHRSAGKV